MKNIALLVADEPSREQLARDPDHLAKIVEDTVWHEVAHYFGMDERQVRATERRRSKL